MNGSSAVVMWQLVLLLASTPHSLAQPTPTPIRRWMFEKPLRVCYVSLVEFSSRCNGSPDPEWEMLEQPNGPVPRGGWCQNGDYCGYDVKVWECVFEKHYL
jgi:hypothetical protein